MPSILRSTWIAIVVATIAVLVTGVFIVRSFARDVFVDCRGTLEPISEKNISSPDLEPLSFSRANLDVRYDLGSSRSAKRAAARYEKVRVAWDRTVPACKDAKLRWSKAPAGTTPQKLSLYRDKTTGLYVVTSGAASALERDGWLAVFAKRDNHGRRFDASRVLASKHVPVLVLFGALGALALAAYRATRATPYATRIHTFRTATLRPDGLVESDTGAALATVPATVRVPAGSILVDPAALEARDVYRSLPVLRRGQLAPGDHTSWYARTMRRLRDAHVLAIVSAVTTAIALIGYVIG